MKRVYAISKSFLLGLIHKSALQISYLLFLLTACISKPDRLPVPRVDLRLSGSSKIIYDTSKIAIIPLDSSRYIIGDKAIASSFITQEDLALVDSLVRVCVAGHNSSLMPDREFYRINMNEGGYRMQLTVFVNLENEKEVWVNALCNVSGGHWKSTPVVVFDGGSCYFQLYINLTTKEIHDSFVNGSA